MTSVPTVFFQKIIMNLINFTHHERSELSGQVRGIKAGIENLPINIRTGLHVYVCTCLSELERKLNNWSLEPRA
jgi:hypothetical protein